MPGCVLIAQRHPLHTTSVGFSRLVVRVVCGAVRWTGPRGLRRGPLDWSAWSAARSAGLVHSHLWSIDRPQRTGLSLWRTRKIRITLVCPGPHWSAHGSASVRSGPGFGPLWSACGSADQTDHSGPRPWSAAWSCLRADRGRPHGGPWQTAWRTVADRTAAL